MVVGGIPFDVRLGGSVVDAGACDLVVVGGVLLAGLARSEKTTSVCGKATDRSNPGGGWRRVEVAAQGHWSFGGC